MSQQHNMNYNSDSYDILKWFIRRLRESEETASHSPLPPQRDADTAEVASLLQCLGFTMVSFEHIREDRVQDPKVKIEITCEKSRMKLTMVGSVDECSCPSREQANSVQIWNVSGCCPTKGKLNQSNNTIIPTLSSSKNKMLGDLLNKIISIICDASAVEGNRAPICTYSSTESLYASDRPSSASPAKPDHLLSPPKSSSSPSSVDSLSVDSLRRNSNMRPSSAEDCLKIIVRYAEMGLKFKEHNATFTKDGKSRKRISDIRSSPSGVLVGSFVDVVKPCEKKPTLLRTPVNETFRRLLDRKPNKNSDIKQVKSTKVIKADTPRPPPKVRTPLANVRSNSNLSTSSSDRKITPKREIPKPGEHSVVSRCLGCKSKPASSSKLRTPAVYLKNKNP